MSKRQTPEHGSSRRLWLFQRLARVGTAIVLGYAALVLLAQRAVSFPGQFRTVDRDGPEAGVRQLWLETSFGRVESWLYQQDSLRAPGSSGAAIIFFHGNGELIDDWDAEMRALSESGATILAVEFPGYGRSDGKPTRATIRESAAAAFDRLSLEPSVDAGRVVAWGRSMGGGAAADLALDRPVAALVLQSTFSSTMAMAATVGVPGFLVRDRFSPAEAVGRYRGPILLMHGPSDEVIPYAQALETAAARADLEVVDLPCGHNDCAPVWPEIGDRVLDFLAGTGILPREGGRSR
jgi:pimeloyl-ACP methyl ester carboxylesterase